MYLHGIFFMTTKNELLNNFRVGIPIVTSEQYIFLIRFFDFSQTLPLDYYKRR